MLCSIRPAGSLTRAAEVIEQRGVLRGAPPTGFSRFSGGPSPPHLEVDGSSDAGSVSGISGGAGQVSSDHDASRAGLTPAHHIAKESDTLLSCDVPLRTMRGLS